MRLVKFVFLVSTQADEAAPRVASGRAADIGHEDGGTSKGGEKRDAARNLDASDAVTTRRRLDKCEDYSLVPLTASECPSSFDASLGCDTEPLNCGDLCEGDSECKDVRDNLDNCKNLVLAGGIYDINQNCKDEDSAGTDCSAAGIVTIGAKAGTTPATYQGDGKWCYSELNLAVDSTDSPAACWTIRRAVARRGRQAPCGCRRSAAAAAAAAAAAQDGRGLNRRPTTAPAVP